MAPIDDPVNLIWNALSVVSAPFNRILCDYGILILFPIIYQFIRCRNLHKAKEHLTRLRQA
jgi:hypothetical protein